MRLEVSMRMMKHYGLVAAIALALVLSSACGATGVVGPTPQPPGQGGGSPPVVTVPPVASLMSVSGFAEITNLPDGGGVQGRMIAKYGDMSTKDVTEAVEEWSTTDESVATVDASGMIRARERVTGQAIIKGGYQGKIGGIVIGVSIDNAPRTTLGGRIFTDTPSVKTLAGATIEVVSDGLDKGRKATSGPDGLYSLTGIRTTNLLVRYSLAGYQDVVRNYIVDHGTVATEVNAKLSPN